MGKRKARAAGAFYLITVLLGLFAEIVVRGNVIVSGDSAATARNILASEGLYRLGFVADIAGGAAYVVVTLLLYELLKPVSKSLSRLAAAFSLIGVAVGAVFSLAHLAPLLLLKSAPYLAPFDAAHLQAMAYLSIKLHALGYDIALVFFGIYEALLGYLIFRSTFLPRALGVLVAIAGFSFLGGSLTIFLSPAGAGVVSTVMLALDGAGELSLMLWLLVMGVDERKWENTAHPPGAS
ncbi:MAG TPA: DUF4386 domain-containing protein [Candidatus Cybelea sp.]|nr:DUF4386 domain-containing protein [Candidatus Cybelea sp.]